MIRKLKSWMLKIVTLSALALSVAGCDLIGTLAKEAVISATSHRGWDTFTFKGQLPAEFGIDVIAFYGPYEPDKASCRAATLEPRKTVTRRHAEQYTAEIQAQPQDFSFKIPLSYYKGMCGMKLGRVKLEINGRYGSQKWQQAYGRGGFYTSPRQGQHTVEFDGMNKLRRTAVCTWWFQQSHARSRFGELEKMLNCRASIGDVVLKELADKEIELTINVDPNEEPSHHDTWIKFPNGWKPCLPREGGWIRCQSPPVFKTFKMNGSICTIYPECKEH